MAANTDRRRFARCASPATPTSRFAAALRQADAGTPIADITRKLGIFEATFYAWRKRLGSLGTPEIRELRQLREENARLKRRAVRCSISIARCSGINH